MLCVKTMIKKSPIAGIGLFAAEPILKGSIVWEFEPIIDILLTQKQLDKFPDFEREQLLNYVFLDPYHRMYMLCGDDARFFNHSVDNNCDDSTKDITIATRDIDLGEELTVNYNELWFGKNTKLYKTVNFTPVLQEKQIS